MIELLQGFRPDENEHLNEAFRLRRAIFIDEKNWSNLRVRGDREIDEFDTEHAVYLLAIEQEKVAGNLRLLPTTRPHLLSAVHQHLCQRSYARGAHVWEWTRFCIDKRFRGDAAVGKIASELTLVAVEWGLVCGVRDIVVECHPYHITRFREFGFEVGLLGLPVEMDGESVVAIHLRYDDSAPRCIRRVTGVRRPVLVERRAHAPVTMTA